MSPIIQVGERTFTTEDICEQLSNSDLLPQVLREMIIDEILADFEIDLDGKIPYNREEFAQECDRLSKLAIHQALNQLQLYKIVDRHLRLRKFKHARWNSRVYSYYLQHKSRFDRVEFSIISVTDRGLAEEIFFRVQSGEQSLRDLAVKYSECESSRDGGKISSGNVNLSHPPLAPYILSLRAGELSPILFLDNLYLFIRLEGYISAELNDQLNQILIDELFENWIQEEISTRLGLFELSDAVDLSTAAQDRADLITDPALLELINQMHRQPEINLDHETVNLTELIEPSVSFFFPKETSTQKYDFEDPTDSGVSSSFFFPKELPPEIVRQPIPLGKVQKVLSFLMFFAIFVGAEIIGMEMFHRSNPPQLDVGSSQLPVTVTK
jgi:hypothetical protein